VESITDNGVIDESKLSFIDQQTDQLLARSRLAENDILFTIAGSIGRVAMVPATLLPANTNQAVAIVRPDATRALPRFLYYALRQREKIREALANTVQSVQANFSLGELSKLAIELPDQATQAAVVEALGALDAKIELNRRMSQALLAMAQAIYESWFADSASDATDPVTLKALTTKIGSGATPRGGREVYVDEGVALIRSQNVYDSQFVWDSLARITDEAATQLANVQVQPGDVLLNITGASILRTCVVPPDVLPARVNQHVSIIRAKPGVSPHYLHLHLLQPETKAYLLGLNAGGSREAVTKAHIESVPLMDPGAERMNAFHQAVAPLFALAQSLDAENRKLASLRDELLPKLLSGELKPGILEEADAAMIAGAVGA
jgi:type I restriction enzyme, S subunit